MSSPAKHYRYWVLLLLTLSYALSVIDRGLITVMLSDIKQEFALSDTELGLLGGLAFALFYSTLAIPIARFADHANRKNIIAAAVGFWSLCTALCGMAAGFWSLFLARVGVGAGEAGGTPPAHSILADYFAKSELGRALSVYSIGAIIGTLGGHLLGSYLVQAYGWRVAFIAVGLPGVFLGALVYFTIKEPSRAAPAPEQRASFGTTLRSLLANKAYLGVALGNVFAWVPTYSLFIWIFPLIERSHDIGKLEIGGALAMALLLGAVPGMFLGGVFSDLLAKRNNRWLGWSPAIWIIAAAPLYLMLIFTPSFEWLIIFYGGYLFVANLTQGPILSAIQSVVLPRERALAVALGLFGVNIIGQALLPVVIGLLSDTLFADYAGRSLNYSLSTLVIAFAIACGFFLYCAKHLNVQAND